jgi:uncharacterized protein YkwD
MKHHTKVFLLIIIVFAGHIAHGQQTVSTALFRKEFLEDINHIRQKGCNCGLKYMPPAPPLVWNDQLELAAMGHAQDMALHNYFSHTSLDGRDVSDRIKAVGYSFKGFRKFAIGENIAQGQESIAEVMAGWLKSAGHCKNLMNPDFKEVGIAFYNSYWVQDFGLREPFSPEMQKMIESGKYKIVE